MDYVYEWDECKRQSNVEKHSIDFLQASQLFDGRPINTVPSLHTTEERYLSVGELERRTVAVVWTPRGDVIRLISARRARASERQAFLSSLQPNS
jgi:uncharacterized DUF497 family protein